MFFFFLLFDEDMFQEATYYFSDLHGLQARQWKKGYI